MEQQLTRQTTRNSGSPGDETPSAPGGAGLANQAKKYGNVARKSRENCQTGQAAEQELQKRRNRSGQ
jgi:hypothetical protein